MKLALIAVGRDRKDPLCLAADTYIERVNHVYAMKLIEVKEEPAKSSTPAERVKSIEAGRLLEACPERARIIAMSERGRQFTSKELAERVGRFLEEARPTCFLVGGPLGHGAEIAERADEEWALSKLTLPHRLARLLLAEQIYRATTILRGEPYHK